MDNESNVRNLEASSDATETSPISLVQEGEGKDNDKSKTPTLKLVMNKVHLGPVSARRKRPMLSKSANKIRLNDNLAVKSTSNSESNRDSKEQKRSSFKSARVIDLLDGTSAQSAVEAVYLFEGYSRLVGDAPGTSGYIEKSAALAKAQNEAYSELGFSPEKLRAKDAKPPVLTEDQRSLYNARVLPYAFDYYEIYLSYKEPGKKAVRTRTYRYVTEPTIDSLVTRIMEKRDAVTEKITVVTKED